MKDYKIFIKIIIIIIIIIIAVVLIVAMAAYSVFNRPTASLIPLACTQEAKLCSDGSYVSRTGKNCEFAKCPEINPSPTPTPAGEKIIKKAGEQEGSFLIQKINSNSVAGLWYQAYPVARGEGTSKTLQIGDDIGYACEGVSEKLVNINFSSQTVTFNKVTGNPPVGGCPICLAGNMLIDTPLGPVAVKDLQVGMIVWTTDASGQRVSGVIIKTSKVLVPPTHQMVHLVLADGRELLVSPGHPTIDGRRVSGLEVGDNYDGAAVISVQRVFNTAGATYDVLPSGETGFYWANGVLLDSTLHLR